MTMGRNETSGELAQLRSYGQCAGCGNPLTDREMFHGHDCCDSCMERDADLYSGPEEEAFWDEDEELRT